MDKAPSRNIELTHSLCERVRTEVQKAVVGQEEVLDLMLAGLLCNGHVLLEGVPGTAKTLLVRTLALVLQCDFKRVQMTPDLMPSDILGVNIYEVTTAEFRLRRGPIFTNLLLADEINRAPAKTQAAMLEAMQENVVTIDGVDYPVGDPFMVFATQNPIEHEGTYPLPEAELDRFLFKIRVDYPAEPMEMDMLARHDRGFDPRRLELLGIEPAADSNAIRRAREEVIGVVVEENVMAYILRIIRETRQAPYITLGGSPRAATILLVASKALAALAGRSYVVPDDVKAAAPPVLRHRLLLRPEAELDGLTPDLAILAVLDSIPVPR